MNIQINETSLQRYARFAGLLYLIVVVAGMIAQMLVANKLVVEGDAAATATNILAHQTLYRLGLTLYLIEMASQVGQVIMYYILLRPVSQSISLLALSIGLVGCVIKTMSRLFYIAPLLVLDTSGYLHVFDVSQTQALALLLLNLNNQAAGLALPFFGLATLLNGLLILRSAVLPRFLGGLSIIGGLGWLTFLYPPLGYQLFPAILAIGAIGSLLHITWLLIRGVNVKQWKQWAAVTI